MAITHTHPNDSSSSEYNGDGSFMSSYFPNKPNYVFMMKTKESPSIAFIIANGKKTFSWENGVSGYMPDIANYINYKNIV